MKAYIKCFIISLLIGSYFITTAPFLLVIKFAPFKTKRILNMLVSFFSKMILYVANVKVRIDGIENAQEQNYFIVSNHLSYIDILAMSYFFSSSYVTSMEMKETPVLGQITTLAGCVFVERRNKKNIQNEIREIKEALAHGLNVVVFPEATSTNGEMVIPFKRSMFEATIEGKSKILPLTLEYQKINGKIVDLSNRDSLFWYGDMDFAPHFFDFCKLKSVEVCLHVNPAIDVRNVEKCSGKLRDISHQIVSSKYQALVGDRLRFTEDHSIS